MRMSVNRVFPKRRGRRKTEDLRSGSASSCPINIVLSANARLSAFTAAIEVLLVLIFLNAIANTSMQVIQPDYINDIISCPESLVSLRKSEILSRNRALIRLNLLRSPLGDDPASLSPAARPHVDDPVGVPDEVKVMLNHYNRGA